MKDFCQGVKDKDLTPWGIDPLGDLGGIKKGPGR